MARNNGNANRRKYVPAIEIENARLLGRPNFSGLERVRNGRVVNSEGNRNFCVVIPDEGVSVLGDPDTWLSAEELKDMGWKLRIAAGSEEEDPCYFLPVKVNFNNRPPIIWSITGKKRVQVTEGTVDLLDGRNFSRINLVINPSVKQDWDTGEIKVAAYLQKGYFYVVMDRFEAEWQEEHPEDDYE